MYHLYTQLKLKYSSPQLLKNTLVFQPEAKSSSTRFRPDHFSSKHTQTKTCRSPFAFPVILAFTSFLQQRLHLHALKAPG